MAATRRPRAPNRALRRPSWRLCAGAVAMGISPIFVRFAAADVGPFASAFWRVALALPVLYAWMRLDEKRRPPRTARRSFSRRDRPRRARLRGRPVLLAPLDPQHHGRQRHLLCHHRAALRGPDRLARAAPAHRRRATLAGLALCLLGGVALIGQSLQVDPGRLRGDLFGVATAFFFGLYFIAVEPGARGRRGPARVTFEAGIVTARDPPRRRRRSSTTGSCPTTLAGIAALFAMAWISHAGGQGLLAVALGRLPAVFSSLVIFLEAIAAASFGWLHPRRGADRRSGASAARLILVGIWVARPNHRRSQSTRPGRRPSSERAGCPAPSAARLIFADLGRAALPQGLDAAALLADNDFTRFFERLGASRHLGPTRTNIHDCRIFSSARRRRGPARVLGACSALLCSRRLAFRPPTPAQADLRLCNMTPSRVGIALGYRDAQGWVTEGWWNLNARGCETLLKGRSPPASTTLRARLRSRRGVDRAVLHVHPRPRIHHPRGRGLPRPRLRPQRLLRGRYRRAEKLDHPAHRNGTVQGGKDMRRSRRDQDHRHPGARLRKARDDRQALFEAGADVFRLNMSHLPREKLRERVEMIRGSRSQVQAADRHPRRPAGAEAARRHPSPGTARSSSQGPDLHPRRRTGRGRRQAGAPAPSRDPVLPRARPHGPDRRRQAAAARQGSEEGTRPSRRSRWRAGSRTARASTCPTRSSPSPP